MSKSFWGIGTVFGNGNGNFTTTGVIIVYVLASPSFVGPNMTVYSLSRNKNVQLKPSILNSADDHHLGFVSYVI